MLALKERADLTDSAVAAKVHLVQPDGTAYVLEVELEVALPVLDLSTAEALVARAHAICPYSNATRGNITVDIRILEYAA
jgi:organic hydroperoxide reductase OsmC/OhrA